MASESPSQSAPSSRGGHHAAHGQHHSQGHTQQHGGHHSRVDDLLAAAGMDSVDASHMERLTPSPMIRSSTPSMPRIVPVASAPSTRCSTPWS